MENKKYDFEITRHGNIFAFCPMTAKAKKALENIQYEDWQMFGGSLMIDQHYAGELADHLMDEGLVVI